MTGRSFGEQWDDKTTTAKVKSKLSAMRWGNALSTDVSTQLGVVHLGGYVQTPEQKEEAGRLAAGTTGVRRVENEIVVVPPGRTAAQAAEGAGPAASPAAATRPMTTVSGEVTAVDRTTGDVTVKTESGDVTLRLPAATAQSLEQGQRLSINAGGRQ
jgi:hyperosmotically inducible protein